MDHLICVIVHSVHLGWEIDRQIENVRLKIELCQVGGSWVELNSGIVTEEYIVVLIKYK